MLGTGSPVLQSADSLCWGRKESFMSFELQRLIGTVAQSGVRRVHVQDNVHESLHIAPNPAPQHLHIYDEQHENDDIIQALQLCEEHVQLLSDLLCVQTVVPATQVLSSKTRSLRIELWKNTIRK